MIEHFVERLDASVVHVRRSDRDVAQRGRTEAAHVGGVQRHFVNARVRRGIGSHPVDVEEGGVVKQRLDEALADEVHRVLHVEPGVTVEALDLSVGVISKPRLAESEIALWSPA